MYAQSLLSLTKKANEYFEKGAFPKSCNNHEKARLSAMARLRSRGTITSKPGGCIYITQDSGAEFQGIDK